MKNQLPLYNEMITVYSKNHVKGIHMLKETRTF